MLGVVSPTQIDSDASSVRFEDDGVDVQLAHSEQRDWLIWATVGDQTAIVAALGAHEHFFAAPGDDESERPWTIEIVDFIAEVLRGDIAVETTFRGNAALSVRHFNLDERGQRRQLGYTAFLTPARLLIWRPKRVEMVTASWR